jgi:hypothetical protein
MTVEGRVIRVRRRKGGWRVRLADTGGALAAAEFYDEQAPRLPRIGARIAVQGRVQYDVEHGWYAVDPVDQWLELRP